MEGIKRITNLREDMSDFLFHFTKGPNAFETLCGILEEGKLRDTNNRGYLCFTETPLSLLIPLFEYFTKRYPGNPMYAPYGIGVKKSRFFELGGRPVIYGKEEEKQFLDKSIQWRFEEMRLPYRDFSWLREWRIKRNKLSFSNSGIMVITKTNEEQLLLCHKLVDNTPKDYKENDGAFFDIEREYLGVSMEDIISFNSKNDLINLLVAQQEEMSMQLT